MKFISKEELKNISNPIIIDLRNNIDYNSGHIDKSINLNINNALGYILKYPKDNNIVLTCYSGYQSKKLASMLINLGYFNVFVLI